MKVCDICRGSTSVKAVDVRAISDGVAPPVTVAEGEFCGECLGAIDEHGLVEGIVTRYGVVHPPRSRTPRYDS